MDVWAVVFGNYEPQETDSVWETKELAQRRARKLNFPVGEWTVEPWEVHNEENAADLL